MKSSTGTIARCCLLGHQLSAREHAQAQLAQLRQAAQRDAQRLPGRRQLLRVGKDDLLAAARRDRKDPRAELVAGRLLEQRRVHLAVQRVLVGAPRRLQLDHLPLLPALVDLHREATHRRADRQRHPELPLEHTLLRILEHHAQLGERQRRLRHRLRPQRHQREPRPVTRRQTHRRLRRDLRRPLRPPEAERPRRHRRRPRRQRLPARGLRSSRNLGLRLLGAAHGGDDKGSKPRASHPACNAHPGPPICGISRPARTGRGQAIETMALQVRPLSSEDFRQNKAFGFPAAAHTSSRARWTRSPVGQDALVAPARVSLGR